MQQMHDHHHSAGASLVQTGQTHSLHGATAYWPGIHFGVRGPTQDETPLSWEEVQHGMAVNIIMKGSYANQHHS